jgi:hypothetical protein
VIDELVEIARQHLAAYEGPTPAQELLKAKLTALELLEEMFAQTRPDRVVVALKLARTMIRPPMWSPVELMQAAAALSDEIESKWRGNHRGPLTDPEARLVAAVRLLREHAGESLGEPV